MKLFEYSALIRVHTVIAAETRKEADAKWETIYHDDGDPCTALADDTHYAQVICASDGELFDVRDPSRERKVGESLESWLDDDAHIIVQPKASVTT